MPKWVLSCPKCKNEFERSQISGVGMSKLVPASKPEFSRGGNECVCPNCGYSSIYFRNDLFYRA
jgi:predicted nucleic-acid-binding Zn-ribbon protein